MHDDNYSEAPSLTITSDHYPYQCLSFITQHRSLRMSLHTRLVPPYACQHFVMLIAVVLQRFLVTFWQSFNVCLLDGIVSNADASGESEWGLCAVWHSVTHDWLARLKQHASLVTPRLGTHWCFGFSWGQGPPVTLSRLEFDPMTFGKMIDLINGNEPG